MINHGACMPKPKTKPLQFKRGSSAAFRRANPILLNGEPAFEWDTKKLKIGDGRTKYIRLPYVGDHSKPENGKSAYEIWLEAGNTGTSADFLESLIGEAGKSAYEIWLAIGNEGTVVDFIDAIRGPKGDVGDSAYQVWLREGNTGDMDEYFEFLRGESAYETWLRLGHKGTESDFMEALEGQSAFEIWRDNIGGQDASLDDYFNYFKGKDGKDSYQLWLEAGNSGSITDFLNSLVGKSAYEIWLDLGNRGTQADFIKSLEGEDGKDGVNGRDGVDGKDGKNGRDGVDGKDGRDGTNGRDGVDGEDGEDGKSAFELWKEETNNPTATMQDYFNALTTMSWGNF